MPLSGLGVYRKQIDTDGEVDLHLFGFPCHTDQFTIMAVVGDQKTPCAPAWRAAPT